MIFVGIVIAPKARRRVVERRLVVAPSRRSRPKAASRRAAKHACSERPTN